MIEIRDDEGVYSNSLYLLRRVAGAGGSRPVCLLPKKVSAAAAAHGVTKSQGKKEDDSGLCSIQCDAKPYSVSIKNEVSWLRRLPHAQ